MGDKCENVDMAKKGWQGTLLERFERNSIPEPNSGCWFWVGARNNNGYGKLNADGKMRYAHRVAWELFRGPIPEGMWVLHNCHMGHEGCCNPDHCYLGTHADNVNDRVTVGRQARGARVGGCKLTATQVLEIVRLAQTGEWLQRELAKLFGVERSSVGLILRGKNWSHLTKITPLPKRKAKLVPPALAGSNTQSHAN